MIIYFLILIILLSPILDNSQNKKIGLRISFSILFFIAAFQYQCSNDWMTYVMRWKWENSNIINRDIQTEVIYSLLMKTAKPIGLYGFLICCAIFNFAIYYYLAKKYIPPKYYWLFVAIFTLLINCFFLLVNTNRQALALSCTMLSIDALASHKYFIDNIISNKYKLIGRYFIAFFMIIIAINIHTSAYAAILILAIPGLSYIFSKSETKIILIILVSVFSIRFFINLSEYSIYIETFFQEKESRFVHYITQIESKDSFTLYLQSLYLTYFICISLYFKRMSRFQQYMSLSFVIFVLIEPFTTKDMFRIILYYYISIPFLIPNLIIKPMSSNLRKVLLGMILLYCCVNFYKGINSPLYNRYKDFQTLFEAPYWF